MPLRGFLTLEATKWQYTHGVRNVEAISPDTWTIDQRFLDRPGNQEIQLALFYSYGSNPAQYPTGTTTSASTSRRPSSCGARTTRSSRPQGPSRTSGT